MPSRSAVTQAACSTLLLVALSADAESLQPPVHNYNASIENQRDGGTLLYCVDVKRRGMLHIRVVRVDGASVGVSLVDRCAGSVERAMRIGYADEHPAVIDVDVTPGSYGLNVWNHGGATRLTIDADIEPRVEPAIEPPPPAPEDQRSMNAAPPQRMRAARELASNSTWHIGRGATYSARWHRIDVNDGFIVIPHVTVESGSLHVSLHSAGGVEIRDVTHEAIAGNLKLTTGEYLLQVFCEPTDSASYAVRQTKQRRPAAEPPEPPEVDSNAPLLIGTSELIAVGGEMPSRSQFRHLKLEEASFISIEANVYGAAATIQVLDRNHKVLGTASGSSAIRYSGVFKPGELLVRIASSSSGFSAVQMLVHVVKRSPDAGFTKRKP